MESIALAVVGPGRAGGAVALAAIDVGHDVVAVVPGPSGASPPRLEHLVSRTGPLPDIDLLVIATPDGAIRRAAVDAVVRLVSTPVVCHLSGASPIDLVDVGVGSFGGLHPLMAIPDATTGSRALVGAPCGVAGSDEATQRWLERFAVSLGMSPFSLSERSRGLYHAGASVASNVTTGVIGLAFALLEGADVEPHHLRRLVEASVANAFDLGPERALTGPVARGDVATVQAHRRAIAAIDDDLAGEFDLLVEFLHRRIGGL